MTGTADSVRYGVFLRPDAMTSAAITAVTGAVRAQFGVVSAGRFPPHATLVGSLPIAAPEAELLAVVADVVTRRPSFEIENAGVARLHDAVVYDIHRRDGEVNTDLLDLVEALYAALLPMRGRSRGLAPDLHPASDWNGHLSLASHELSEDTELGAEVDAFVRELEIPHPARFDATTVTTYRLHHPTWTGSWWTDFRWERVRSAALLAG